MVMLLGGMLVADMNVKNVATRCHRISFVASNAICKLVIGAVGTGCERCSCSPLFCHDFLPSTNILIIHPICHSKSLPVLRRNYVLYPAYIYIHLVLRQNCVHFQYTLSIPIPKFTSSCPRTSSVYPPCIRVHKISSGINIVGN